MKRFALLLALIAVFVMAASAGAAPRNGNGKIALHYAGLHDAKAHTCDFTVSDCNDLVVTAATSAGDRIDVYAVAIDVEAIAGVRFGLSCVGTVFFYGWTSCADFDVITSGWPGCGEGASITWNTEQAGPNVVIGILDTYIYADSESISTTVDPRVNWGEFCDGAQPLPVCHSFTSAPHFCTLGVNGTTGTNQCSIVPNLNTSWGQVKSLYR
jgi:hypothetical protein